MGHQSGQPDGLWAYNNLQAKVDFGFRATHVVTVAGKAITAAFYHSQIQHAYYMGCSTGGREGLVEVQRFPWDFDGVIAGAPVITEAGTAMDFLWNLQNSVDAHGHAMLSLADLQLVHAAVLAKGDLQDGVRDGIIPDPRSVPFDPEELVCRPEQISGCLTGPQARAVKRIYGGPVNSQGEKLYQGGGPQRGSELNWLSYAPTPNGPAPIEKSGVDTTRYMLSDLGPGWNYTQFNFDSDFQRLATMEVLYAADNVDLRQFKRHGGKLLVYQGWSDPAVAPLNSVDYYETVERTMGSRKQTQDFYRLFMVPGMNHCFGGEGAYAIDYLSYMEEWVENDKPPRMLQAAHLREPPSVPPFIQLFPLDPLSIQFTRPVYPYPLQARYKGEGDTNTATSFAPFEPSISRKSTQ
jgi:feruloyl esterase